LSYTDAPTSTPVLLVSGCSLTHGCEIHNSFMHPKNVEGSYSRIIADKLGLDLKNVALSGASNDWIFLSIMEQMRKLDNIHSVIVAWTGLTRFTWQYQDRFWMMCGPWATSIKRISSDGMEFPDWKRNIEEGGVWYNTDDLDCLETLKKHHRLFVEHYLDDRQGLKEKLLSYSMALRSTCHARGIKFVELAAYEEARIPGAHYLGDGKSWRTRSPHPDPSGHKEIAEEILNKFY
jgi:hypothetical protein